MAEVRGTAPGGTTVAGSEELLGLLVNALTEYAIFLLAPDGTVVSWNPGAQRLKGYRDTEIIGRHFSVFYTPEDVAAGKPEHELTRAANEGSCTDEGWRVRKDGTRFWAHVVITALRDGHGNLRGFAKVTRDDTRARAAAERATALQEIMMALLAGQDLADVLGLIAASARRLVGASGAWLVSPADGGTKIQVLAADGDLPGQAPQPGEYLPADGTVSQRVLRTGEPLLLKEFAAASSARDRLVGSGAVLAVPLVAGEAAIGVLLAVAPAGATPFRPVDLELLRMFAAHAAVVIEYDRTQQELRERVAFEDRERIARELHLHVISELSWTGMSLQTALLQAVKPQVRDRMQEAVDRLDATMREIRNVVFQLESAHAGGDADIPTDGRERT